MPDKAVPRRKKESPKEAVTRLLREAYCLADVEYDKSKSWSEKETEWRLIRGSIACAWRELQPSVPSTRNMVRRNEM